MTIVTFPDSLMSIGARGSFAFGRGYGDCRYGKARYGSSVSYAGIYQKKKTLKGYRVSQMKFYRPTNPQTPTQQAWRAVFADAWVAYAGLTTDQKLIYSKKARKLRLSGPQLFLKQYLQAHTT